MPISPPSDAGSLPFGSLRRSWNFSASEWPASAGLLVAQPGHRSISPFHKAGARAERAVGREHADVIVALGVDARHQAIERGGDRVLLVGQRARGVGDEHDVHLVAGGRRCWTNLA
jgi:hypothetical protein